MSDITEQPDLYAVLGVTKDASPLAIRQAYRKQAAIYHPDVAETGDVQRFNSIRLARDVLTNPKWRENYDKVGTIAAEEADNAIAVMMTGLSTMFGACMHSLITGGIEPARGDFIAAMHQAIKTGFENANKQIGQLEKSMALLLPMQGRFKVVNFEHPNHMEAIVRTNITELQRQIDGHRATLRNLETARLYLADVRFDPMTG